MYESPIFLSQDLTVWKKNGGGGTKGYHRESIHKGGPANTNHTIGRGVCWGQACPLKPGEPTQIIEMCRSLTEFHGVGDEAASHGEWGVEGKRISWMKRY